MELSIPIVITICALFCCCVAIFVCGTRRRLRLFGGLIFFLPRSDANVNYSSYLEHSCCRNWFFLLLQSRTFQYPIYLAFPHNFGARRIQAALVGVTSAVVGVIMNLAVFFGSKVLFPASGTVDSFALVIAIISFIFLQKFHTPIHFLVPIGAVVGMIRSLLRLSYGFP